MKETVSHIVIYSHGFGARKTARGLFTEIAAALPHTHSVMFDYDPFHEESNTITVKPLQEQAFKLRKVLNATRTEYPDAAIDIVAHSQGCVVVGLLKPRDIRKVIMITPPDTMDEASIVKQLSSRKGVDIDVATKTHLARTDGSTTVIHPEYWQSLARIKPVKLFNNLARFTKLRILAAKQDEVLGEITFKGIDSTVSLVKLEGNHNFDDIDDRKRLLYILQKELASL